MTRNSHSLIAALTLGAALLVGCAPPQSRQPYLINEQQAPVKEPRSEPATCSRVLAEIQRLENAPSVDVVNTYGGGGQPMSFKSNKAEQLGKLKTKATNLGCYAPREERTADTAEDGDGPPTRRQRLSFDQCFAKCRELTQRSAEQCFDACR